MDLETFYNENVNIKYVFPTQFEQKTTPYIPLLIDGPWKEILEEVKKIDNLFVTHRDDYSEGWASLCLHGYSPTKTDSDGQYPEHAGQNHVWTEISDMCPVATEYFKNVFPYDNYERLRFMRLSPGGYIIPHNDGDTWTISAVNISLNNPEECKMVLGGVGVVPFKDAGGAMAFNTSYEHCVWNRSSEHRYHMIVHGTQKPEFWNSIIPESYKKYVELNAL